MHLLLHHSHNAFAPVNVLMLSRPPALRKALEKQKTVAHPVDTVQSQMLH